MNIAFFGAAGEVTGSATLLVTEQASILIDWGLFQGGRKQEVKNRPSEQRRFSRLDAVVVTHAHLDHTGCLPLLVRLGYSGPIYATEATLELAELVLQDSARLQASDAQRQNRKNQRAGRPLVEPLYTPEDVDQTLCLFQPVEYDHPVNVAPGITARWVEAGHLLGSATVEVTVNEDGGSKTVVASGDIGPGAKPLIRDLQPLSHADVVIMETTYGDRNHRSRRDSNEEAMALIRRTVKRAGKVLVPSFALGRTQELLYGLAGAFHSGRLPKFPVYIDSPMAIKATEAYRKHRCLFDEEALALVESGQLRRELSQVVACSDASESMALNDTPGPMMTIAGSGMCMGGRILHHLRHNLWRRETAVIFVGYQAQGSLGRRIVDGAETAKIFGEPIRVRAQVATINGYSGHAGQAELVDWYDAMSAAHPLLILTHGEERSRTAFARVMQQRYGVEAVLPDHGETLDL